MLEVRVCLCLDVVYTSIRRWDSTNIILDSYITMHICESELLNFLRKIAIGNQACMSLKYLQETKVQIFNLKETQDNNLCDNQKQAGNAKPLRM